MIIKATFLLNKNMPVDVAKVRIQLLAQSPQGNAYDQKGESY